MSRASVVRRSCALVWLGLVMLACGDDTTGVSNPVPGIVALSQASAVEGDPDLTLTVSGSDFIRASSVRWNGATRPTSYVSATELRAVIPASDFLVVGTFQVSVVNPAPGGGASNDVPFVVQTRLNPPPSLTSLTPDHGLAGAADLTVTVTGAGFVPTTQAYLDAVEVPAVYVSPTSLNMTIPQSELANAGIRMVAVVSPWPGGGVSNQVPFAVNAPVPTVTSLTISQTTAGQDDFEVEVNGTGFIQNSVVRYDGAPRTTTWVSATRVRATLLASDIAGAGVFPVSVENPAPGGGVSNASSFTVVNGTPDIAFLPSSGATAGRPGFLLTVHGTGFVSTSVVRWNGSDRPTTYISGKRLTATISAGDVAAAGLASVTVVTPAPGGGTSNAVTMTIRDLGVPMLTSEVTVDLPANDLAWDAGTGKLYASIPSTVPLLGNTIVALDPATGAATGSVFVGSEPTVLAPSGDGQFLWVALEGAGAVRSVTMGTLTAGLMFALSSGQVEEMEVMPGQSRTLAIAQKNPGTSPRHLGVYVYDDGVRRTSGSQGHTGSNSIAFGESASVIYGLNNETTEFGFRTLTVGPSGVAESWSTWGLVNSFYARIRFANGRVYATTGQVVDAERHEAVATLGGSGEAIYPDPVLGRVFILSGSTISAYDMNNFQLLGSITFTRGLEGHPALSRTRLVRWGTDGIALRDGQQTHILRTTLAAP